MQHACVRAEFVLDGRDTPQTALFAESARSLALSEAGSKKKIKSAKAARSSTQFPPGTEWELMYSDAIILLGLNHALRSVPAL